VRKIRTTRETPPLLALRGREKGQSKVWPLENGGVVPRYRKPPCLVGEDT